MARSLPDYALSGSPSFQINHQPHTQNRVQLRRGDRNSRAFSADSNAERKLQGAKWEPTTSETATIRLGFDANTKVITADYNADASGTLESFVIFYTIDISKVPEQWQMKSKDTFEFSIVIQSVLSVISSGDMNFDKSHGSVQE